MKKSAKITIYLLVGAVLIGLLAGAALLLKANVSGDETTYHLTVIAHDKTVFEGNLKAGKDQSLLESMRSELKSKGGVLDDGGFITSVCGISQDNELSLWWVYTLNGEQILISAGDYHPLENDSIEFTLKDFSQGFDEEYS